MDISRHLDQANQKPWYRKKWVIPAALVAVLGVAGGLDLHLRVRPAPGEIRIALHRYREARRAGGGSARAGQPRAHRQEVALHPVGSAGPARPPALRRGRQAGHRHRRAGEPGAVQSAERGRARPARVHGGADPAQGTARQRPHGREVAPHPVDLGAEARATGPRGVPQTRRRGRDVAARVPSRGAQHRAASSRATRSTSSTTRACPA